MSEVYGRDGRPLITTRQAAYLCGWSVGTFRKWAERRGLHAKAYRATGGPGAAQALWDIADILDAQTGQSGQSP